MYPIIKFYSNKDGEIFNFLSKYHKSAENSYKHIQDLDVYLHSLEWQKEYKNPIEVATVLGVFADNMEDFADLVWNNLNNDNKVSLFVRYINIEDGSYETKIINKNN